MSEGVSGLATATSTIINADMRAKIMVAAMANSFFIVTLSKLIENC